MKKWEEKTLGELLLIERGGSPRPIEKYMTNSPDGINWIKISDATASDKYIYETKEKITRDGLHKTRIVNDGDFILSNSMSYGRPYIMRTTGCIHDGWLVLKENGKKVFDPEFLYYLLGSPLVIEQFDALAVGSTVRNLNIGVVSSVKVPLPPLSEQKRIAGILDAADRLRQQDKALIGCYNQLAQSVFLEMFGGNEISSVKLGEITEYITKGESPGWQGFDYQDEGVLFVTSENVGWGNLLLDKQKYVPIEFDTKIRRSRLEEGNLLVNLVGASIGRAALVDDRCLPGNINQAVASIKPKHDLVNPQYLLQYVLSPLGQLSIKGDIVDAARANLSLGNLREMNIPLPPLPLQQKFAEVIENIEHQKAQAEASGKESEGLFQSLLQAAFKGEL